MTMTPGTKIIAEEESVRNRNNPKGQAMHEHTTPTPDIPSKKGHWRFMTWVLWAWSALIIVWAIAGGSHVVR